MTTVDLRGTAMSSLGFRRLTPWLGAAALSLLPAAPGLSEPAPVPASDVGPRQAHPVAYVAQRWLFAESAGLRSDGWLEARTSFEPGRGFRYTVTAEGGSPRIRRRALHALLQGEQRAIDARDRAAITSENYVITPLASSADGRLVRLEPRRRDKLLVQGEALLDEHGCLKRVRGRLAKSPSFWVKWATVVREYVCLEGTAVPVRLESTADVRFAGLSRLVMTYDYESINGRTVRLRPPARRLGPALLPESGGASPVVQTVASAR